MKTQGWSLCLHPLDDVLIHSIQALLPTVTNDTLHNVTAVVILKTSLLRCERFKMQPNAYIERYR